MPTTSKLALHLDLRSHVPIFLQLVEGIKLHIATGQLVPGDQLPPVRKLADVLGINPNTVDRAYQELIRLELVETHHGRGTFIKATLHADAPPVDRAARLEAALQDFITTGTALGYTKSELLTALITHLNLD